MKSFSILIILIFCFAISVLPQDSENKDAVELYNKALEYYNDGEIDKAIDSLNKSLKLDINFSEARKKLIEIYMYHEDLLYRMMAETELKRAIMDNPENFGDNLNIARTYLKYGLIYNDKKVLESFEYILTDSEKEEYEQLSDDEREKFINKYWKNKDPLYLTEVNERRLENFRRFAHSNLNFNVPEMEIDGWKSDRGKIYIRYGQPNMGYTGPKTFSPYIVWYYPKLTFVFSDPNSTGEYRLYNVESDLENRGTYFEQSERDLQKVYPENYNHNYGGRLFAFNYYTACFRGENGNTHMEIYYGIPQSCIQFNPDKGGFSAKINEGFFIFDEDRNDVKRHISSTQFYLDDLPDSTQSIHIARQNNLEIQSGNYMLAIEIQDESSKNIGIKREAISVESFKFDSLKLSDFILGITINNTLSKSEFTSRGFENIPNPAISYLIDQPLYLYYEIYNLKLGPPNITNYTVEYKINREKEESSWIVRLFYGIVRLFGIGGEKEEISTLYKYSGINPTEKQYLTIDMKDTELGVYRINLSVIDLNSGQKVSKYRNVNFTNKVINYIY